MNKFISNIVFFIFGVVGIGLIIGSFNVKDMNKNFKDNAVKTTGTIVSITAKTNDKGDVIHNVIVEYDVKGKTYTEQSNYYSSDMSEGQSIDVYYNKTNPRNISVGSDKFMMLPFLIMLFMGIVFALVGIVPLVKKISSKSKISSIRKNGELEYCLINNIDQDTSLAVNGYFANRITFERTDPETGERKMYRSQRIWEDVYQYVKPGDNVAVYFDRKNPKKFYVDAVGTNPKANEQSVIESNM